MCAPKQSTRVSRKNTAQEKSQTPVFSAFGFDCLGASGPGVAAEGHEQPRQTRGKHGLEGKGEAKPEAVFRDGIANVPDLAKWLTDQLTDAQLAELLYRLSENPVTGTTPRV